LLRSDALSKRNQREALKRFIEGEFKIIASEALEKQKKYAEVSLTW
jgi:hypothetical protein